MTRKVETASKIAPKRAMIVHACAWYGNVIYDLGIHNDFYDYPFVDSFPFSEAIDVNNSDRIVGNSFTINSHYRGFILDAEDF